MSGRRNRGIWRKRYLKEVGEAPLNGDQTNALWISIFSVNVMEHTPKSAVMRREGALGVVGHGD